LRTTSSNVIELYEDTKHGMHANVALYHLKNQGDLLHFCFWQNHFTIQAIIDKKVDEKVQYKIRNLKKVDKQEIMNKIWNRYKIGCKINLKQNKGMIKMYLSNQISKPD
jgi:hypothetical protein